MVDPHIVMIRNVVPSAPGCENCLRIGLGASSPMLVLRPCRLLRFLAASSRMAAFSTRPVTRSSSPSSWAKTGVGATSTKPRFEDRVMVTALDASPSTSPSLPLDGVKLVVRPLACSRTRGGGPEGSNPAPSSGESRANLTSSPGKVVETVRISVNRAKITDGWGPNRR